MKKRILSVFLTVAMLLTSAVFVTPTVSAEGDASAVRTTPTPADATGLWTDFAATAFEGDVAYGTEGHGTAENPYKIATPEQLAYLAKLSNEYTLEGKIGTGTYDFATDYFVLTEDLDLSAHNWNPIASTYTKTTTGGKIDGVSGVKLFLVFKGNIDGQGHTIKGITFNDAQLESSNVPTTVAAYGLFGVFGGILQNLKVEGTAVFENIKAFSATNFLNGAVAILAGVALNGAMIENVEANVFVDVTSEKAEILVGGMVGYSSENATFRNCVTYGSVKSTCTKGAAVAGGMIGATADGTDIYDSANYIEVKAITTKSATIVIAGGFVGKIQASANADADNFAMGVGSLLTGLSNCTNYGNVFVDGELCKARVGSFIGQAGRASTGSGKGDYILNGCVNHGAVTTNYYHTTEKEAGVSALVGLQEAQVAIITKCFSSTYATCTDETTAANLPKALVKHLQNKTINGTLYSAIGAFVPEGNLFVTPDSGVITVADGARLRLNPSNEKLATLRFDCVLAPEAIVALASVSTIVGTIIVSTDVYAAAAEGTSSTAEAVAKLAHGDYRNIKATYGADGVFAALYANITATDYGTEFVAIPYLTIILDEKTGESYTVYDEYAIGDDARTVSVKGIAAQYIEIRSDDAANPNYISGDQIEILESYLNK